MILHKYSKKVVRNHLLTDNKSKLTLIIFVF